MRKVAEFVVKHKLWFIIGFALAAIACGICMPFVGVNYDNTKYLPADTETAKGLEVMYDEFGDNGAAVVMGKDLTLYEAYQIKQEMLAVSGVKSVLWLDDILLPMKPENLTVEMFFGVMQLQLENLPEDQKAQLAAFYKDGNALFQVTMSGADYDQSTSDSLEAIVKLNGGGMAASGPSATAHSNISGTMRETNIAMLILIPILLVILIAASSSFWEPVLFIAVIGVSVLINMGTNLIMGEISYLTMAVSAMLQMALSMDYSIFLLSRFKQEKKNGHDPKEAMVIALSKSFSPLSASSLTTVAGFVALMFMRYRIGLDMGIVLAKGIIFSLASVFLLMPGLILMTHKLIDRTAHKSLPLPMNGFSTALKKSRFVLPVVLAALIIPCYFLQAANTFQYGDFAASGGEGSVLQRDRTEIESVFGSQNSMVILLPRSANQSELPLSLRLMEVENVSAVQSQSLVELAGGSVSLPESFTAQFNSENYTRIVLTLDTPEEGEKTTATVQAVRDAAGEVLSDTEYFILGASASAIEIQNVVEFDFTLVNWLSIALVALIILVTFRSLLLPVILVLVIQGSIWINMAIPYLMGQPLVFIGYMIVNCVQLGATIDYGILLASRYMENRRTMDKFDAIRLALTQSVHALITSAGILCAAGFTIGLACTLPATSILGMAIGRGAISSFGLVLILLPQLLVLLDKPIRYTTLRGRRDMIPNPPRAEKKSKTE